MARKGKSDQTGTIKMGFSAILSFKIKNPSFLSCGQNLFGLKAEGVKDFW